MSTTDPECKKLVDQTDHELKEELIPKETKDHPHVFNETKSIIFALLTGCFYALHNFTLGGLAKMGYLARFDTGIGMGIGAGIYYTYQFIQTKRNNQKFFDWKKSIFRNQNTEIPEYQREKFEYWILAGIISIAVLAVGFGIVVIISFKLALEGGMNQGIITAIYGMTPFIASILFYLKFGETLKVSQLIGMVFMIVCIIMIGLLRAPSEEASAREDYNPSGVAIALILSIICPFAFALNGLIIRLL